MLALALVTLFGPSLTAVIVVVVLVNVPGYARIIRTQTLALKSAEFVTAAQSMGASTFRILRVHMLPNTIGPLLILVSMDIPVVIAIEAGMSFLGLASGRRHPAGAPFSMTGLPPSGIRHGLPLQGFSDHPDNAWLHLSR